MIVESIVVDKDTVMINDQTYPINTHVFVCNGVQNAPKNLVDWFSATRDTGMPVRMLLRFATVYLNQ